MKGFNVSTVFKASKDCQTSKLQRILIGLKDFNWKKNESVNDWMTQQDLFKILSSGWKNRRIGWKDHQFCAKSRKQDHWKVLELSILEKRNYENSNHNRFFFEILVISIINWFCDFQFGFQLVLNIFSSYSKSARKLLEQYGTQQIRSLSTSSGLLISADSLATHSRGILSSSFLFPFPTHV